MTEQTIGVGVRRAEVPEALNAAWWLLREGAELGDLLRESERAMRSPDFAASIRAAVAPREWESARVCVALLETYGDGGRRRVGTLGPDEASRLLGAACEQLAALGREISALARNLRAEVAAMAADQRSSVSRAETPHTGDAGEQRA